MTFAELLEKMAAGQPLDNAEQQELVIQARRMQETSSLFASLIRPGTKILILDGLETQNAVIGSATAGNGDVNIDGDGIWMENNQAAFGFETTTGERYQLHLFADSSNFLHLVSTVAGKGIVQTIKLTDLSTPTFNFKESVIANKVHVNASLGVQGGIMSLDNEIGMYAEGSGGGATYLLINYTGTTPPTPPSSTTHIYLKGDKLIIQYDDAGTVRWKYLDLTGTGVTWVHTTSAP